jgi:hypothetical protein
LLRRQLRHRNRHPHVVAFSAAGGGDYDPVQYITATSPDGERVGTLEFHSY